MAIFIKENTFRYIIQVQNVQELGKYSSFNAGSQYYLNGLKILRKSLNPYPANVENRVSS
jgi:hypothetical protein